MVGSAEQDGQSVAGRLLGVIVLGHRVMSEQPFVGREVFKLREQSGVYLAPVLLQFLYGREWADLSGVDTNMASSSE